MSSEVLVAILGFLGTLFGSCAGALASSRLTNYRLEQVEKKVDAISLDKDEFIVLIQRVSNNERRIERLEAKETKN